MPEKEQTQTEQAAKTTQPDHREPNSSDPPVDPKADEFEAVPSDD